MPTLRNGSVAAAMPTHGGGRAGSRCPLDSCDDNLEGIRDGGEEKENYSDSRPGSSETSRIAMAFMAGLTLGKNWVQPLIRKRSMEPFVVTRRGAESSIISRRSVEPLMVPLPPAGSLGSAHPSGLGQVPSLLPDSSMSSHGHGGLVDPTLLPVICGETSSGPAVGSSGILLRGLEVLLELICTNAADVPAVKSPLVSLHGPDLSEVQGLISASETSSIGNSPEEDMVSFIKESIPSRPYFPTGKILFEISSIRTNLCLIKTIVLYDDQGSTLVYKSKEGEKDRFIKRRSIWLSEDTGRKPYAFMDSLVLRGPTRPMTAYHGCWIMEIDVPVESSFEPEDPEEIPGRVFETTFSLDDDSLDKPRGSLISMRGGIVVITSVTFSNALRSTIRFVLLCSHPDGSFDVRPKVEGELVLSVESYPVGFTVFKNQVEDDAVHFVRRSCTAFGQDCTAFEQSCTAFELPLLRHVVALPVGSRVRVHGTLKLATLKVFVDQYLVLDESVVWARWTLETGLDAAICIEASSTF